MENYPLNERLAELVDAKHPSEEHFQKLAMFFKVVSDETRIKILFLLAQHNRCVNEIATELDMTISAISHQLRILKQAELVKYSRQGKNIFYSLNDDHVGQIFVNALEHILE